MDVNERGKHCDENSILVEYSPGSMGNQFATFWNNNRVLKSTFRYNGSASSRHSVLLIQLRVLLSPVRNFHGSSSCPMSRRPTTIYQAADKAKHQKFWCHPGRYPSSSVLQRMTWYRRPQVYIASPSCVAAYTMDRPVIQSDQVEPTPLAQPAWTTRQGCRSRAQIWPTPSHPTPGHQNPLHQTQLHGQVYLRGNWVEATSQ